MEIKERTWNEALSGVTFIKFESGTPKTITLSNWSLQDKVMNVDGKEETKIAFVADVIMEDGFPCEKILNSTSIRFQLECRPIFENREKGKPVTLQVIKVGDKKTTAFSVKEVKGGAVSPSFPKPKRDLMEEVAEIDKQLKRLADYRLAGTITEKGYEMALEQLRKQSELNQ